MNNIIVTVIIAFALQFVKFFLLFGIFLCKVNKIYIFLFKHLPTETCILSKAVDMTGGYQYPSSSTKMYVEFVSVFVSAISSATFSVYIYVLPHLVTYFPPFT